MAINSLNQLIQQALVSLSPFRKGGIVSVSERFRTRCIAAEMWAERLRNGQ